MEKTGRILLTALAMFLLLPAHGNKVQAQEKIYDETINAFEQISTAIEEVHGTDKYILCQVGGNWCPWCLRFADFAMNDSVIAPIIKENFVYIHINYSKENKNPEAMEFLGNPARFGFPVFVIINDEGTPIHIQESASLEEGKGYSRKKVQNFLINWTKKAVTTLK